uniref:F-box domain-containing protein n=1 Tax=Oryza glumipatula TaxID=40148 RepID=A0A0D9Z7C1_9ORYZ
MARANLGSIRFDDGRGKREAYVPGCGETGMERRWRRRRRRRRGEGLARGVRLRRGGGEGGGRVPAPQGIENGLSDEVLKAVFPLLDGKNLVFCMLVCRQRREIAKDDYFWKCICARKWPSICKQPPSDANYQKLYLTFSKPRTPQHLPVPKLTFEDLVFYIDMWLDGSLIFSQAVSGCILRGGLQNTPCGIPDVLVAHLIAPDCILTMEVEPKLEITMGPSITVSVLVH